MRHEYDVFERFPDGSTLWRASITGRYEANRKMHEFAERSENHFFMIDIHAAELLPPKFGHGNPRPLVTRARQRDNPLTRLRVP